MVWLHYQQLISTGYYYSDIPAHMAGRAMGNTGFSLVTILLRFVFSIGGNLGTAVFLGAVNLLTLLTIAWAIRKAVPQVCPGGALLWSLAANLCQAVWMPNGGHWYNLSQYYLHYVTAAGAHSIFGFSIIGRASRSAAMAQMDDADDITYCGNSH